MKYKNIVWDWNGTLLNDLHVGVNTLNRMLSDRGLTPLTVEEYKDQFGFPVVEFYRQVGFDLEKESLHELSVDFVKLYDEYAEGMALNPGVPEVLPDIQETGVKQYILSALREDLLHGLLADYQVRDYFKQACGSDNIYASGKVERGKRMVEAYGLNPAETLMVGDTVHDAEVAEALGFDCILYTGGHNSDWRLREKAPVIHQFKDLPVF